MKTQPIVPARIDWDDDGTPRSPDAGDLYHARVGALAQARHVFVAGNGLPGRWQGRADFTLLELGFGLGGNFLALWDCWRADPARSDRLHVMAIERHPPAIDDLRRAHAASPLSDLAQALIASWPPPVPGLHTIDLDAGRVRLLLCFGDVADLLPGLACRADAFVLDGFAPARNPRMWEPRVAKALARLAAPGATAATWSVARVVREGLAAAGFEVAQAPGIGGKRAITQARYAPRTGVRKAPGGPDETAAGGDRRVVVVGAGLAGACVAADLAALGFDVEVLESAAAPAAAASGNPAGIFHGTVHAGDGPYARLFRAGALCTRRLVASLARDAALPCALDGVVRVERGGSHARMAAMAAAQRLPAEVVLAVDSGEASRIAGVPLADPAWWHRAGGWVAPGALVQRLLDRPRITLRCGVRVAALASGDGAWHCLDAGGRAIASAPAVVLAAGGDTLPLLRAAGLPLWPERRTRGQLTVVAMPASPLRLPVAGDGYAIPLPGAVLCGASDGPDSGDPALRDDDHRRNLERLQRLTGLVAPADPAAWQGRAGLRLQTDDRLPVAGPVPLADERIDGRRDQARLLPRTPGLHVLGALGGRGLTLAPLLGRLVAARIAGTPLPIEQDLVDAVDPGRWIVRAARRGPRTVS